MCYNKSRKQGAILCLICAKPYNDGGMNMLKFAIIGAGAGGQTMAAVLSSQGYSVKLQDIDQEKIRRLQELKTIKVTGKIQCEGTPERITDQLPEALEDVDVIMVVSTTDASALRDAQRTVTELMTQVGTIHLVVNRVQPKLLKKLHTTIDDAMDAAGLPLLGVVPEDNRVMLAANQGIPLILSANKGAAVAYRNIALRIDGQRVPLMKIR